MKMNNIFSVNHKINILLLLIFLHLNVFSADKKNIVNDVTQLNPVEVEKIIEPQTIREIVDAIKSHAGPVSIGGGRYSMGGHTATERSLHIDMRKFNQVISFSKDKKEITVQAGITWRKVQEYIDKHDLSVKIKQTYSNFTVGGSLSVNVHGRYIGLGPIILSVISIKVILPDGNIIIANPKQNSELFYGAIGGYGALGVIAEATLSLTDNVKVERVNEEMSISEYKNFFFKKIREDSAVIFHNADIYPDNYNMVRAISYNQTDKPVNVEDRLIPLNKSHWLDHTFLWIVSEMPFGKWIRENILDPLWFMGKKIEWRNYEASYDVEELEPSSREKTTYVLQEYFVPVEKFDSFVPLMAEIFNRHEVNVINVSIRHARKDPGSLLAWAKNEVFAFVVYYKQGTSPYEKNAVGVWTRELIDAAISLGGSYYLPYQIHATDQQFHTAYPHADLFFALKKKTDPDNKFRNKLWDAYYKPVKDTAKPVYTSRFKAIMSDKRSSDGIYLFLQNVYGLYPTDQFHYLIKECTEKYSTDKEIYQAIQLRLPEVTPALWSLRYALPALRIQKKEIARETVELIGADKNINGYLEIGTTGRYVNAIDDLVKIEGPVYLTYYEAPTYNPQDIVERGQLTKIGTFFDLDHYNPIPYEKIPDASLDLITIYIGLHHSPSDKLDGFVKSLWRILRPGGKLVIRDHNVTSPEFGKFVSVVHDIFYCGLGESWEYTNNEIRNFSSSEWMVKYLEARGFKGDNRRLLQKNDPSKNTLIMFTKLNNSAKEDKVRTELMNIKGYKRDEAQTYLTLPEWFLVYSPDEYAHYIKKYPPSGFPYFGSIDQFWSYYKEVYEVTKDKYEINWGYHFMIFVIGTSYTVENVIKGVYENTIGRFTEWTRDAMTQEDVYAAAVAQDYVDFIRVDPWYEFPFYDRFKRLWADHDFFGSNLIRKWERKFFLSCEYGGKAMYAWLIKLGTKKVYGDAEAEMLARVIHISPELLKEETEVKMIRQFSDSSVLLSLPRYEAFRNVTVRLVKKGMQFEEIAGNKQILMTCVVPKEFTYDIPGGKLLFEKPILTEPMLKRIAIQAEVTALHRLIIKLSEKGITIEHLYDY